MRSILALLYALSFALLAFGAKPPLKNIVMPLKDALKPGNVVKIAPSTWGSGGAGASVPHPAAVVANDDIHVHLAPLTHKPIPGQNPIATNTIAPSLDDTKGKGKQSHLDLNLQKVEIAKLGQNITMHNVPTMQQHELVALHKAVAQEAAAKAAEKNQQRLAIEQQKAGLKVAAKDAANVAQQKQGGKGPIKRRAIIVTSMYRLVA